MTYVINPYRFASANLLLDEPGLGSAFAAWSVARKLRSAYAGSAIRVRRTSDDAEQDVGFSGNELDTSSLETFCSGTDGYLKIIYDQSGNAFDVTQTVFSQQQQIVSSGVTLKVNGKPASLWTSGNRGFLNTGGVISAVDKVTMMAVSENPAGAHGFFTDYVIAQGYNTNELIMLTYGIYGVAGDLDKPVYYIRGNAGAKRSTALTGQNVLVGVINSTDYSFYVNNESEISATAGAALNLVDSRAGFGNYTFNTGLNGDNSLQEGVIWHSDLDAYAATIKSNVNAFYSIY